MSCCLFSSPILVDGPVISLSLAMVTQKQHLPPHYFEYVLIIEIKSHTVEHLKMHKLTMNILPKLSHNAWSLFRTECSWAAKYAAHNAYHVKMHTIWMILAGEQTVCNVRYSTVVKLLFLIIFSNYQYHK